MHNLQGLITQAAEKKIAIGHFNFSNLEGWWAIVRAAEAAAVPVILGVSEGERDFVGVRQAAALVNSLREESGQSIFLNADHSYSFERVREAVDAGFDAVIFDGATLPFEENIQITKQCVEYAKSKNPAVIVEGELGYIGASSQILDALPVGMELTAPSLAAQFVRATNVDILAPAVGNVHGMLKSRPDPGLDIARIKEIREAAGVPLVLHGASGNSDEEIKAAIAAGVTIVHINTELRVAYRDALKLSLQDNPDEVAPYKILKPALAAMQKVAEKKLRLFSNLA